MTRPAVRVCIVITLVASAHVLLAFQQQPTFKSGTKTVAVYATVTDKDGRLLTRWGTPEATASGSFAAPHGIAVDSGGDIYVAEVTWTFAESRGRVPAGCHTFQKFTLKS